VLSEWVPFKSENSENFEIIRPVDGKFYASDGWLLGFLRGFLRGGRSGNGSRGGRGGTGSRGRRVGKEKRSGKGKSAGLKKK
jgi:hypothetical protein